MKAGRQSLCTKPSIPQRKEK